MGNNGRDMGREREREIIRVHTSNVNFLQVSGRVFNSNHMLLMISEQSEVKARHTLCPEDR